MPMRLSGLASGMDTESIISELMKAQRLKTTRLESKITTIEWKQEKWKALNTKIYSFYTDTLAKMRLQSTFMTKNAISSDESRVSVSANVNAPQGNHTLSINQLASAQFATGSKLSVDNNLKAITSSTKLVDLGLTAGETNQILVTAGTTSKSLTVGEDTTIADFTSMLKSAGLNASYDTTQQRFFISSKESGYENAFSLTTAGTVDLSKLGLHTITKTDNGDGTVTVTGGGNMSLVSPKDAAFIYNGAQMTSKTNSFTANGITFNLKGVTEGYLTPDNQADDKVISITVGDNTKAVYDTVKDFIKKYNELIKEMNDTYYAPSAKGYNPLTDEEKETMTDDQIEKWETKIKDSLLRRDDGLGSLISTMRSSLSSGVTVNGKKYALSSFGIGSANFTEKGVLHINGDADDSLTSSKTNDLMEALTKDPDTVMKVMNQLATGLHSELTKKMSGTTLRSALTLYNDKEMTKQVTSYKEDLKEMENKLKKIEDRYYKQFAAMESAMSKMNSQSSNLASMLGMGGNK